MAITIDGTNGLTTDNAALKLDGTTLVVDDTNNRVGIGTGSPSYKLDVTAAANTIGAHFYTPSGESGIRIETAANDKAVVEQYTNGNGNWRIGPGITTAGAYEFNSVTAGSTRMLIDSSGNLLVGTASNNTTWNAGLCLSKNTGTTKWAVGPYSTPTNFIISSGIGTGVYLNGTSATSWSSASDERLKENLIEIDNGLVKVCALRSVTGNFISDKTKQRKAFLIAQDVQAVLPEAVSIANEEDGYLGVAYTDVIPLLVAAIKEQQAIIEEQKTALIALTARVEALEGTT